MTSQENAKKRAGYLAADLIKTHTRVGVGTGSTVAYFIERLVERTQKENLQIFAAASSLATMALLQKARISLIPEDQIDILDISVDGADQITPAFEMIKGGGGALLREKIIAQAALRYVIIADGSKKCARLWGKLPVEISPFGARFTQKALSEIAPATLRPGMTDNKNLIIDLEMEPISDVIALDRTLHSIAGVLSTGLFYGLPSVSSIIIDID